MSCPRPADALLHEDLANTLEVRVTRLEETAFFQEERLRALDAALTAQQAQLDAMERQVADLRALARSLRDKLAEAPENALPPHFMPERY